MSKFTIEVDIPDPPPGYGSPEWGVWEDGCLWWSSRMDKWSNFVPTDRKRIICRPLPLPVQYREPDILQYWNKPCEFSDDGELWHSADLCGYAPRTRYPWMSKGGLSCVAFWKFARIAVKAVNDTST